MKNLVFLVLLAAFALTGFRENPSPTRKTYLYCKVDTLWQKLPAYNITSNAAFPYNKLATHDAMIDAAYRDGVALIELEIDRPVTLSVMPVRDSTVGISWSDEFFIRPGDSLELSSEIDTTIKSIKCLRPLLIETTCKDNTCDALLKKAFPYSVMPKVEEGDLARYKTALEQFYQRKRAFVDSCRMQMPLSEEYLVHIEAQFRIGMFNSLCHALEEHPESEVPEGYLGNEPIPETAAGSASYVLALENKYVKHAVADPIAHFEEVQAGIRKAPRKLRDHLTALMIGYFASQELPRYKAQLEAAMTQAEQTIRDTLYLQHIARARKLYEKCGTTLPADTLQQTKLRAYDSDAELTLADVFRQFEGQPIYLDFWSSWCVGCIMDIKQSAEARQYLSEAGVAYVCISLDEDADAWLKAAKQYDVVENSYLGFEEFKSPTCNFFEIKSIPRYIIFDRQHRIMNSSAPRPVKRSLDELKRIVEAME